MQKNKLNTFFKLNGMAIIPMYSLYLLFKYQLYIDNLSFLSHDHLILVILLYGLVIIQFGTLFKRFKKLFVLFAMLLLVPVAIPYEAHTVNALIHVFCGYSAVFVLNIMLYYSCSDQRTVHMLLFITLLAGMNIMVKGCVTGLSEIIYLSGISFIITKYKMQ